MSVSRRSVIRSAAWTAPAVVVATAAPAFATSDNEVVTCAPKVYKLPGKPQDKSYVIVTNCVGGEADRVTVDGREAHNLGYGKFLAPGFGDSRSKRNVVIYVGDRAVWSGELKFDPWKPKA